MRRCLTVAALSIGFVSGCHHVSGQHETTRIVAETVQTQSSSITVHFRAGPDASPEDVLRAVMFAITTGDHEGVRRLTVTRPGMELLMGTPVTDQTERAKTALGWKTIPMSRVETTTPNAAAIMLPDNRVPHVLLKVDGAWKYDPGALIAARQAAAAARDDRRTQERLD